MTPADKIYLRDTFMTAWHALYCGVAEERERARQIFVGVVYEVMEAYGRPDRCYHNLNHLDTVLSKARNQFDGFTDDCCIAILAALFHDAVYKPGSAANEHESARLASASLHSSIGTRNASRVANIVLLTAEYGDTRLSDTSDAMDPAAKAVLRADLWSLGENYQTFKADGDNVLAEYGVTPGSEGYRAAQLRRLKFLQKVLVLNGDLVPARAFDNVLTAALELADAPAIKE
jgi:predicted metal-dependent HD superfamily phosphohydrolase